jgi:hypothetical protein
VIPEDQVAELKPLCRSVVEIEQNAQPFLYMEGLRLPAGCEPAAVDALLALHGRDGYPTRLYLQSPIRQRGANWSVVCLLDRTWHTWSWKDVSANQRVAQVLAEHLRGLR